MTFARTGRRGILAAAGAAALFGLAAPAAKSLTATLHPVMLAGLLYLGSGIGLGTVVAFRRSIRSRLTRTDLWSLAGAVALGGIAGPILLVAGLARTTASAASLLLNAEAALTAVFAWFLFREAYDRRIAAGMACIVAGAVVLSGGGASGGLVPSLLVLGACACWALDNNLTRKVAHGDAVELAAVKGLVAGTSNVAIALVLGASMPDGKAFLTAGAIGLLGYGVSLALFIVGLRELGASRASAYFSLAPFVGTVTSIVVLGDPVTWQLGVAAVLMGAGAWLHLTEVHSHEHVHESIEHAHEHEHDEHHQHGHDPSPPRRHSHVHRHDAIRHSHAHAPDIHHRHDHVDAAAPPAAADSTPMSPRAASERRPATAGASRQHHYVAKAYLGGFTDSGTSGGQLWVLDIELKRMWKGTPAKVARERDYNTVQVEGVDPLVFEEALGRIEAMTLPIIRAIEATGALPSPEDMNVLMNFVALQFLRVPSRRKVMHGFLRQWAQMTLEIATSRPDYWRRRMLELRAEDPTLPMVSAEDVRRSIVEPGVQISVPNEMHLRDMSTGVDTLLPVLAGAGWVVLRAPDSGPYFVTSDDPVCVLAPGVRGRAGFAVAGAEITFPLTRRLALVGLGDGHGRVEESVVDAGERDIERLNARTFGLAERFVLSPLQDFLLLDGDDRLRMASEVLGPHLTSARPPDQPDGDHR